MTAITIHSKSGCPHCDGAKAFLAGHSIPFTEVRHDDDAERNALYDRLGLANGNRTVPQVIIHEGGEDFLLGGFQTLKTSRIETLFQQKSDQIEGSPCA